MEYLDINKKSNIYDIETIVEMFNNKEIENGAEFKIKGTLHRIKDMSGFAFVNVRSSRLVFQCIWEEGFSQCVLSDFSVEECVNIDGIIVKEERSVLGFDVKIKNMIRISGRAATPLPIEISNNRKIDKLNLNTMLDNRVLSIRNTKVRAMLRISDGIMFAFRDFLRKEGFTEFVAPKFVETGAEGGADMFEVDYFGKTAYLNQSPQMYKQFMVGSIVKAYTLSPVFRAEKYSTNRHINEFQGLDLEIGFIDSFYDLMILEARMFNHIYNILNEQYATELEMYLGKGKRLPQIKKFPVLKFEEAKKLYAKAHPGEVGKQVLLEPDLTPDEEKWLGEYAKKQHNSPIIFITHYPSVKRPFYTMDDPENPKYTLSFDMLLNGMEVTTGGQRIHDYTMQVTKMQKRGMDISNFENYLTMHKFGMPPHGGLGLGLERIVQNILGLSNIKLATSFPRDRDRLYP